MAMFTTSAPGDGKGILPPDFAQLITQPVADRSIAYLCSSVHRTGRHVVHFPQVTDDPAASWVAEGAEIPLDDAVLAEIQVAPSKVAGLTKLSAEMAGDSDPAANQIVGDGLARDIARKVDSAFFGSTIANGPAGLGSIAATVIDDGAGAPIAVTNLDPFARAISQAWERGAVIDHFVASPADALGLAQLKDETGSNRPLLGPDPTDPTRSMLQGVPLVVSRELASGTIWGVPSQFVYVVERHGTELEVDRSVFFTSHQVAVRAIMRIGFGFVYPAAVQKISVTL